MRSILPFLALTLPMVLGCATIKIERGISRFEKAADTIKLGDSKETVLSILEPTQSGIARKWRKPPESHLAGQDIMEIHYFRSARHPDNITTDDEFTPYIFKNGRLVGIGWASLGGPKTQSKPPTNVFINR